jgi:hypothetical protein
MASAYQASSHAGWVMVLVMALVMALAWFHALDVARSR